MYWQRTLRNEIKTMGIGLHSGLKVEMTLRPAPPNSGIRFYRTDLQPPICLPAQASLVGDTRLAPTLECDGVKVATVEHLLAAVAGLGIDNLDIDLTASEIPIMDGSAGTFVYLLQSAGLQEQNAPKYFYQVMKPVEVVIQDKWARLEPHFGYRISFTIDFGHPAVDQTAGDLWVDFDEVSFVQEIARARTFGFMQDVESLRSVGLARGGSFENALVLDEYRILNEGGLRFQDEFVRHKVLDAMGDLYLAGGQLLASYTAHKSGHDLNNKLLRALFAEQGAVRKVAFNHGSKVPKAFAKDWAWV